ncbi:MAG: hypothetical protein QOF70_7683 [Acetobacteraceae bacterium]|jgi:hypothetical protein|nr:hypothetical protein [Rhodopila sp.]MEA2733208.1 hypothetical protein [Acetobacteraceae bacterium]
MADISDYLSLAEIAYTRRGSETPRISGWTAMDREYATWSGNGFQGVIFEGQEEVIVALAGTMGGVTTAPISQNSANLRIGLHIIPNMAGSGKQLVKSALGFGKPVSIVGHSLGGALAQVIGAWTGRPFISFNGPGMARHLRLSAVNIFKPRQMRRSINALGSDEVVGVCFNVRGDFVGGFGSHIGTLVELNAVATANGRHDLDTIRLSLGMLVNEEPKYWHPWFTFKRVAESAPQVAEPDLGESFGDMFGDF